jgi:formyl-CoA transferase
MLAAFGADVIKVEHPNGDPVRSLGWSKDGLTVVEVRERRDVL